MFPPPLLKMHVYRVLIVQDVLRVCRVMSVHFFLICTRHTCVHYLPYHAYKFKQNKHKHFLPHIVLDILVYKILYIPPQFVLDVSCVQNTNSAFLLGLYRMYHMYKILTLHSSSVFTGCTMCTKILTLHSSSVCTGCTMCTKSPM